MWFNILFAACSTCYHPPCSELLNNNNSTCPADQDGDEDSNVKAIVSPLVCIPPYTLSPLQTIQRFQNGCCCAQEHVNQARNLGQLEITFMIRVISCDEPILFQALSQ